MYTFFLNTIFFLIFETYYKIKNNIIKFHNHKNMNFFSSLIADKIQDVAGVKI